MMRRHVLGFVLILLFCAADARAAQDAAPDSYEAASKAVRDWSESVIPPAVDHLLSMEEGEGRGEWPYEGVYRVGGMIPIGYRVGGTGIVAMALLRAPGYVDDQRRIDAVQRATAFVIGSTEHPRMQHAVDSTYDVRGWGYAYGLRFLAALHEHDAVAEHLVDDVSKAMTFFVDGIIATEIPERGGWNYARRGGFKHSGAPASPFMTASTLQALFAAEQHPAITIDAGLVERGLAALLDSREASGAFVYAGRSNQRSQTPGATGRMLISEATLVLAGRGSVADVRGALDAFFAHWDWLDKRRAQQGTHVPPFGIAPYYFYYAHYYAAQCIELLPQRQRPEYQRRLRLLIKQVQDGDAVWNDRVFDRSASYGTAMAVMALRMPHVPDQPRWMPPDDSSPQ